MDERAFDVATKHLFRHLHEPHALRKNLLVQRFFGETDEPGAAASQEYAVLDRIHELIRRGADQCRDADIAAGRDDRALRQHAIIVRQCLERQSIQKVASALGVSRQHCYRERADICRRVARYLHEYDGDAALEYLPQLDEFELLIDRAMHHTASGALETAFREYDELIRFAPSDAQRMEALRVCASAALDVGEIERAQAALATARVLWRDRLAKHRPSAHPITWARLELMESKFARYRADTTRALTLAQSALSRLAPVEDDAPGDVRKLFVETLYELGAAYCNFGDLERGYDSIAAAEREVRNVRSASIQLRARITVTAWRLRNHLLLSSKSWYPSSQRLNGLIAAFEELYAAGLLAEAAGALVALAEYYAFVGNDAEALRTSRLAVLLTKHHPSRLIRTQTSVRVAMSLLSTRHWEYAFELLPGIRQPDVGYVYDRELVLHLAAERAFRHGSFHDAQTLAAEGGNRREYAMLTVGRRLLGAEALYKLGRDREARSLIETTMPAAEHLGSAPILRDAYTVAATIIGDPRLRDHATQIAKLLTA